MTKRPSVSIVILVVLTAIRFAPEFAAVAAALNDRILSGAGTKSP
jgi:hypothetical protein